MATSSNMEVGDGNSENDTESTSVFPGYKDVNEFSQKTLRAVLMATRSSNDLPVGDDFDFYSTFRSVRDVLDIEGRRVLTLLQRLLRHQNVKGSLHHGDTVELEDQFDVLMDANDQILERAGTLLDEASGVKKEETKLVIASTSTAPSKMVTSWNKKASSDTSKPAAAYRLMTARNIQRPQLSFRDKIDNTNSPFKPQIRRKPHALKPLEESLKLPEGVTVEETERPEFIHPHPYKMELETFQPEPQLLKKVTPQEPQPVNLTPLLMVDNQKQLEIMLNDLKNQTEIAVDLEHHSYRSFQGLTCLMQISTRSRDYIVDTLELRNQLHVLNDVFADPKITKVLHGADSDIGWLQRDFGVYIVNMFDTGQAARVLGFSRFSLAHLMLNFCHIEADKQFQLADWRIRPLPEELINYAREDTHYLLYIYDMMRNQLIDRGNEQSNLLFSVYDRSKAVAAKVYQKPVYTDQDYMELYRKSKKVFNAQQLAALQDLYAWRDGTARIEDESLGYVLPNHMLLQIAEILPRERQGVLACCNPIPPLVRQSLVELHNMVLKAREITIIKVEKAPVLKPSASQHPVYDANSMLNCPHDMTHVEERVARIEEEISKTGLIATTASMFSNTNRGLLVKKSPIITAFSGSSIRNLSKTQAQAVADSIRKSFKSPFVKFLHQDENSPVKPQKSEIWRLKPPTSMKRKAETPAAEVDLDSFQPEFVPPTKKPKVAINLTSTKKSATSSYDTTNTSNTTTTATTTSSLFRVPESKGAPKSSKPGSLFRSAGNVVDDTNANNSSESESSKETNKQVEIQIKSIRQEMAQKKKKEKKKKTKREKKLEETAQSSAASDLSPIDTSSNDNTTKPSKKSNIGKDNSNIAKPADSAAPTNVPVVQDKKEKKKKKKKKLTVAEVEQNFAAFDYAAAEKNLIKDNKAKSKVDVYNPALPSRAGKQKDKARRPKLAGPKSKMSISFGPGAASPGIKKKKNK